MTYSEINNKTLQVSDFLAKKEIKAALDLIGTWAEKCKNKDFIIQVNNHIATYKNILKYSFEPIADPDREKVYNRLIKSIIELADDIREDLIFSNNLFTHYTFKDSASRTQNLTEHDSDHMVDVLTFEKELEKVLESSGQVSQDKEKADKDYHEGLVNIFKIIWLTDRFGDAQSNIAIKICKNNEIPWYDKSIIVSALTLSLLRHFDSQKINILFEFFENREDGVWQRALVGLVAGLYKYDKRLEYYPEIVQRLKVFQDDKLVSSTIETIIIQIIKAKDTEKITKKINEELMPEMIKLRSKLEDKLDLENIHSVKSFEDKNPDWETMFQDSPGLVNKFEEFSNLQMDGADVFLSAFAMLKRFDFFNEFSNWFMPFYKDNLAIKESFSGFEGETDATQFVEGIEKTAFLCNSDKYSFCLNVKHMPSLQKSTMVELFNMELKAMNEMSQSDELVDAKVHSKTIITQYLQDLYRFFKLHPIKHEFDDVFIWDYDFINSYFFNCLVEDDKIIRNIGEFYFEKGYFVQAIKIFENLPEKVLGYEVFEKTAFSYQQLGNYPKALENYLKAELFDKNRAWIVKKIAYCYRKLRDYKKSVEYYLEALQLEPENLYILTYLGHTYMDMEDYETALQYYFKVEYMAPDNHKIQRPIAWCSFVMGKFDVAQKYFQKLISKEANENDFLNLGHVLYCMGNKKEAIESYKQSLRKAEMNEAWFRNEFGNDSIYLIRHGINSLDISLMQDYVLIGI